MDYTRAQLKEVQLPLRIPLLGVLNQRGDASTIDSRVLNGYLEQTQEGVIRVSKRPALTEFTLGVGSGLGGGAAYIRSSLYSVIGTNVYKDITLIGTVLAPLNYHIIEVPTGLTTYKVFFNNGKYVYIWDGTTLSRLKFAGESGGTQTCSTNNLSPIVGCTSTTGLTKYSSVSGAGIPADSTIISIDSPTQITISQNATATSGAVSLSFILAGPPYDPVSGLSAQQLVPRSQVLNNAVYVLSIYNELCGADADDPTAWNPLNKIIVYSDNSPAISLSKQLSYLVAVKKTCTEFFRDAGNSPGSPLERIEGLRLDVGGISYNCLQESDDKIFWVSRSKVMQPSVWMLVAGKPQDIATPAVRRILQDALYTNTFTFSIEGHTFFAINKTSSDEYTVTSTYTLVYDLTSDYWSYWTTSAGAPLAFVSGFYYNAPGFAIPMFQRSSDGKGLYLDPASVSDTSGAFNLEIFLPEYDARMRVIKYLSKLYVTADQVDDSVLELRVSDDNQQTWTAWREIDLSIQRPRLDECGSFYKRTFHFRHASATHCRLESIELDLYPGTL